VDSSVASASGAEAAKVAVVTNPLVSTTKNLRNMSKAPLSIWAPPHLPRPFQSRRAVAKGHNRFGLQRSATCSLAGKRLTCRAAPSPQNLVSCPVTPSMADASGPHDGEPAAHLWVRLTRSDG
jgi:hypothetical protein